MSTAADEARDRAVHDADDEDHERREADRDRDLDRPEQPVRRGPELVGRERVVEGSFGVGLREVDLLVVVLERRPDPGIFQKPGISSSRGSMMMKMMAAMTAPLFWRKRRATGQRLD